MISLAVALRVRDGHLDEFLRAITENALHSFRDEPGCLRFDVSQAVDDPRRFVLYELYEDLAAIEAHRAAPHFAAWRRAADAHVVPGSQNNTVSHLLVSHDENHPEGTP